MMMLLDTHVFVWLVSDQTKLSDKAKQKIASSRGQLFLSSASGLEMGLLVNRGRLSLPVDTETFIRKGLLQHGIQETAMDWSIALDSTSLPRIHNDPVDRILIATALRHNMTIVSKDAVIPTYPSVRVIW